MQILLYRPNEPTAFRKYDNPNDVVINKKNNEVWIIKETDPTKPYVSNIAEKFVLVKRHSPVWVDETKPFATVMVKLDVKEIEPQHPSYNLEAKDEAPEYV